MSKLWKKANWGPGRPLTGVWTLSRGPSGNNRFWGTPLLIPSPGSFQHFCLNTDSGLRSWRQRMC